MSAKCNRVLVALSEPQPPPYSPTSWSYADTLAEIDRRTARSTAVVDALDTLDRRTAMLFAEEAALRLTLTRAMLFDPADVDSREPLWSRLHELQRGIERVNDQIKAALDLNENPPADPGTICYVRRGPDGWEGVESWRYPYLAAEMDDVLDDDEYGIPAAARRALALAKTREEEFVAAEDRRRPWRSDAQAAA